MLATAAGLRQLCLLAFSFLFADHNLLEGNPELGNCAPADGEGCTRSKVIAFATLFCF